MHNLHKCASSSRMTMLGYMFGLSELFEMIPLLCEARWVGFYLIFVVYIGRDRTYSLPRFRKTNEEKKNFVYFKFDMAADSTLNWNLSIHINVISFATHKMLTHFTLALSIPLFLSYFTHFSMGLYLMIQLIYLFQLLRLLLLLFFELYIWVSFFIYIQRRFTLIIFGFFIVRLLRV